MARLMEQRGSVAGGRKLSFKTKGTSGGNERRVRATKVNLPAGTVQEIAARFNAVVVGNEAQGRELLRRLHGDGNVKAAVKALETGVVLVRKPGPTSKRALDVPLRENKLSIPKDSNILESVLNEKPKPNASFLWKTKTDKENVNDPVEQKEERQAYGKIRPIVKANTSSLYKNLSTPDIIPTPPPQPEKVEEPPKKNVKNERTTKEPPKEQNVAPRTSFLHGLAARSETSYEDVEEADYEEMENNYASIGDEAIYDDVINVKTTESIYETVDNRADSDSSCDQSNSLYGIRPPSQASTVSGAVASGASRSDTSDDWVDLDAEEQILVNFSILFEQPYWSEKKNYRQSNRSSKILSQFLLCSWLRGKTRNKGGSKWSQQVRRQWSKRAADFEQSESDNGSGKHYEAVENLDDDSALCDDFDDSSDSESSSIDNEYKLEKQRANGRSSSYQSEGIYGFMREAGKKVRKTSWSIGQSLRRISRITTVQTSPTPENGTENSLNLSRGRWSSLKKFKQNRKSTSTFYLKDESEEVKPVQRLPPKPVRTEPAPPDVRRLSAAVRPSSPPPPPPPMRQNGDLSKKKVINDTTWYSECGLFDSSNNNGDIHKARPTSNSWYSDIGLYENNRPSDSASEHSSSQGSDLNLRFADEPLYQFYAANVAEMERTEYEDGSDFDCYEEIGTNNSEYERELTSRPSALELVNPGINRTLWCQVPQVVASGILDTLTPMQKKLQEAKFELMTSEASYYKSLTVLEKHFASSPQLKDETVISKLDHKTLFSNVTPVRKCSEIVLGALEKCWQDSILLDGVCDLIYDLSQKHFQVYIKYCTNQISIETTLKKLKNGNNMFAEALATLENSPKCQSLSLYSFLLLPMQRVTRMPLLLDAILMKLDPGKSEYDACRLALAHLNKIAHECNEAARRAERYEEMAVLSRGLVFPPSLRPLPLLSASRWLVRSGQVTHINMEAKHTFSRKLTARNIKLTLFLLTDYLLVAKKKGEDHFSIIDYCPRSLVQMTETEDAISNRFLILLTMLENHEGKTQEMVLCCGSESSRERWLQALSTPSSSNPDETLYADWDCPQVSATHSYTTHQPDELPLQQGDVVNVLKKLNDGWYYGERIRDGEKGWFPGNHSREIASQHVRARNLKQRYRLLALSANYLQQQKSKT